MGEIAPYISLATLLLLALNFAFGRGDKSAGRVEALAAMWAAKHDALTLKHHEHELAMKDMEARLRDHIGGGYATKADINGVREELAGIRAMFEPIAQQLGPHAVRR